MSDPYHLGDGYGIAWRGDDGKTYVRSVRSLLAERAAMLGALKVVVNSGSWADGVAYAIAKATLDRVKTEDF